MSAGQFHVTAKGDVALCQASKRACPLEEGHHFADADEAADWSLRRAMETDLAAFDDFGLTDEDMQQFDSDLTSRDADYDDQVAMVLEDWADEESMDLDAWESGLNEWLPPSEGERSVAEEATIIVKERQAALYRSMPTEWGMALLDLEVSTSAASELASYQGYKALDLLANDIEAAARDHHADGLLTARELEEELETVGMLRFLVNPSEGRRGSGPREPKPLDPELIQALRCLYIKRFGVDPFEQGVSVPQLLQMRQQRLI